MANDEPRLTQAQLKLLLSAKLADDESSTASRSVLLKVLFTEEDTTEQMVPVVGTIPRLVVIRSLHAATRTE